MIISQEAAGMNQLQCKLDKNEPIDMGGWSTINHTRTQLTAVTGKSSKTSATFYNQCNNIA